MLLKRVPLYNRGRSRLESAAPTSVPHPPNPDEVGAIISSVNYGVESATNCHHKFFLRCCRSDTLASAMIEVPPCHGLGQAPKLPPTMRWPASVRVLRSSSLEMTEGITPLRR